MVKFGLIFSTKNLLQTQKIIDASNKVFIDFSKSNHLWTCKDKTMAWFDIFVTVVITFVYGQNNWMYAFVWVQMQGHDK